MHSTTCDGTRAHMLPGCLCPWRSQGCFPTSCRWPMTCKRSKRKRCPIPSLLFGNELDNFSVRKVAKRSPPPTANLPRDLNVVLMINKNNSIWVSHRDGFIHSFIQVVIATKIKVPPKSPFPGAIRPPCAGKSYLTPGK